MPPIVVKLLPMPTIYEVGTGDVIIDVTVGDEQKGLVKLWLDNAKIAEAKQIKSFKLGKGSDLIGKSLEVITTVTVTNPNSSHTSVTYLVTGGKGSKSATSQHQATPDATIGFQAVFQFKEGA